MEHLNLDTAVILPITIRALHSWSFKMEFFDDNVPVILTGVWKFTIFSGDEIVKELLSDDPDSGFSMSANALIWDIDTIKNDLGFGKFKYELRHDEDNYSTPVFEGPFTAKQSKK